MARELLLAQPILEPFAPTFQGAMYGRRRRRQPPLQDLQGEADAALPLAVAQPVGPVHLLPDVGGDRPVEGLLGGREVVAGGVGAALGEERRPVEAVQLLLGQAAHHVRHVCLVDALAETPLEPVGVQQAHEQLEVRLFPVVRGGGHQEEVARPAAEELAELVAPGLLHLAAEVRSGHAVGLVADDEVPVRGGLELGLQVVRPRRHVEAEDQPAPLREGVAGDRVLDLVAGHEVEGQAELLGHLLLPLLDQAARGDDEAALEVAPDQQLLDKQPGHDRLAGAGVVGQQEAQRLPGQHLPVDGGDLVGERLDLGGADREVGVEQVRQPEPVCLRREAEQAAVGVEAVGAARFEELEGRLLPAVDQPFADAAVHPEDEVERVRPEPGDLDDFGQAGGVQAPQAGARLDVFEHCHAGPIIARSGGCEKPLSTNQRVFWPTQTGQSAKGSRTANGPDRAQRRPRAAPGGFRLPARVRGRRNYFEPAELAAALGERSSSGRWNSGTAVPRNNGLIEVNGERVRSAEPLRERHRGPPVDVMDDPPSGTPALPPLPCGQRGNARLRPRRPQGQQHQADAFMIPLKKGARLPRAWSGPGRTAPSFGPPHL